MEITIRNLTRDTMIDFNNDHTISLPMDDEQLRNFLGNYEWMIIDSPIGEEFTDIMELNELLGKADLDTIMILNQAFSYKDTKCLIENEKFTIVNFSAETSSYYGGNGVINNDWWKGYVLHNLGYIKFPFKYTEDMEEYVCFDKLWVDADANGWVELEYNEETYLVNRWG